MDESGPCPGRGRASATAVPFLPAAEDADWMTELGRRHLLPAGSGLAALERALTRYPGLLSGEGQVDEAAAGFGGIGGHRDL